MTVTCCLCNSDSRVTWHTSVVCPSMIHLRSLVSMTTLTSALPRMRPSPCWEPWFVSNLELHLLGAKLRRRYRFDFLYSYLLSITCIMLSDWVQIFESVRFTECIRRFCLITGNHIKVCKLIQYRLRGLGQRKTLSFSQSTNQKFLAKHI